MRRRGAGATCEGCCCERDRDNVRLQRREGAPADPWTGTSGSPRWRGGEPERRARSVQLRVPVRFACGGGEWRRRSLAEAEIHRCRWAVRQRRCAPQIREAQQKRATRARDGFAQRLYLRGWTDVGREGSAPANSAAGDRGVQMLERSQRSSAGSTPEKEYAHTAPASCLRERCAQTQLEDRGESRRQHDRCTIPPARGLVQEGRPGRTRAGMQRHAANLHTLRIRWRSLPYKVRRGSRQRGWGLAATLDDGHRNQQNAFKFCADSPAIS